MIDKRFEAEGYVALICEKCGCRCKTKNLERVGNRSILPIDEPYYINYLALLECNNSNHTIQDLRILTSEEYTKYRKDAIGFVSKENKRLADRSIN